MDLAKISLDLKNLVEKCYVSWLVWVFSGFGEKTRDQIDQIRFRRKRPAANRWSSQVDWQSARVWSCLSGGLGHRLSWTPLKLKHSSLL